MKHAATLCRLSTFVGSEEEAKLEEPGLKQDSVQTSKQTVRPNKVQNPKGPHPKRGKLTGRECLGADVLDPEPQDQPESYFHVFLPSDGA